MLNQIIFLLEFVLWLAATLVLNVTHMQRHLLITRIEHCIFNLDLYVRVVNELVIPLLLPALYSVF